MTEAIRRKSTWIAVGVIAAMIGAFLVITALVNGAPGRVLAKEPVATAGDFGQPLMMKDFDQLISLLVEEKQDGTMLLNHKTDDALRNKVMTEILSMNLTSSVQPMPGLDPQGQPDVDLTDAFQQSMQNMERTRNALATVKENKDVGAETRAAALEMHNFLGGVMEAMGEVANQTAQLDPQRAARQLGLCQDVNGLCVPTDDIGDACPGGDGLCNGTTDHLFTSPIDAIDKANAVGTVNPHFRVKPYFRWQMRSPWVSGLFFPRTNVPEQDIRVTEAMAPGECTAIMKEIEGMKVVVRPKYLGYWVEPWYARRHFVGRWVWAWEWLPAEIIKTISYCNNANAAGQGSVDMEVDVKVIPMPQLRDFWWFFPKDP